MRKDVQDLWLLAEPYVRDAGFDLIEVQSGREPTGWVVRLFIDRPAVGRGREADGQPLPERSDWTTVNE